MKNHFFEKPSLKNLLKTSRITIVIAALLFGGYQIITLSNNLSSTKGALASSTAEVEMLNAKYTDAMNTNSNIMAILTDTQKQKLDLEVQKENADKQIDTLTKLTTLDPELLKKYSKVYFLNENYVPPTLDFISSQYVINPTRQLQILTQVKPFLDQMLQAANGAGIPLRVVSAYRSYETQKSLKSTYVVTYGAGTANQFSAEQGYSEHQLGTALDFGTPDSPSAKPGFEKTTAYNWMVNNAYQYGFILSYPPHNKYYEYEPWHWRFVGRELALYLHQTNQYFYDTDQRTLDSYLIKIFD